MCSSAFLLAPLKLATLGLTQSAGSSNLPKSGDTFYVQTQNFTKHYTSLCGRWVSSAGDNNIFLILEEISQLSLDVILGPPPI